MTMTSGRCSAKPLERRCIASLLKPKRIVAPDYDYEFQRAWKNGVWHAYEPLSLDLQAAGDDRRG